MLPIEAWLKLTKKMKKDEYYKLYTFATLGKPALLYQIKLNNEENLEIMGVPSMGGVKLTDKIILTKDNFMDLYPLYFSQALFDSKYAEIMQYSTYIFPLITEFIEGKDENYFEIEDVPEVKDENEQDNKNIADEHLRSQRLRK